MTQEIQNVLDRKANFEKVLLFQTTILQKTGELSKAKDIQRCIEWRLDAWEDKKHQMLIKDAEWDYVALLLSALGGELEANQLVKMLHHLLIHQGISAAVAAVQLITA